MRLRFSHHLPILDSLSRRTVSTVPRTLENLSPNRSVAHAMPPPSASTYRYKRIDLATDAIRLVHLTRGYHNDPIECRLFETWLHQIEGVPYEALSYHWGSPRKDAEIMLDGCQLGITENLSRALTHLRLEDRDRILWVDAICIDQDDEKERGHQVGQMRDIYRNAEQVIVWLGPSTNDIALTFDKMNEMHDDIGSSANPKMALELWRDIWPSSGLLDRYRHAFEDIFRRRWFQRVWVIQEVASARAAVAVCGWKSVSTKTFVRVPSLLDVKPRQNIQAVLDVMPGHLRKESWWSQERKLCTLMVKFAASEATDTRDRIYALLGISSDACDRKSFPPDYEIGFPDFLRNAARFLIFGTVKGGLEYTIPVVTLTELIQDFGRLRRDAAQWAIENLDPEATRGFLKCVKLSPLDELSAWELAIRRMRGAKTGVSASFKPGSLGRQPQQSFDVTAFLTEREDILEERDMGYFLSSNLRKQRGVGLVQDPSGWGALDTGAVLYLAASSGHAGAIEKALDLFYRDLGLSYVKEFEEMEKLLRSHTHSHLSIAPDVTIFYDAVRRGYEEIPKLLVAEYSPSTVDRLLMGALEDRNDEGAAFVLSHTTCQIGKLVLLKAIEMDCNTIFGVLLDRSCRGLGDLADILCATAAYRRTHMAHTLLNRGGSRNYVWEFAFSSARNAGNTRILHELHNLRREVAIMDAS
ncbi:heterokaryon incompatibility protein-domain-containing protein [Immersiella caudata]|uniref:Heterokaryon incompatibility protein-domain-containing protein n=1 Tax=Immersiella caudata TaxID=314043 RepID=A0AA39W470_9PEZI|nr:heterokaryon incompatibility protein-domain-containing protein [Immersiella caudata]